MNEKNYATVLETLAKRIEDLELTVYLKDIRIAELEEKIGGKHND